MNPPSSFTLIPHALVEVRGDDAATWLQGQLTQDVLAMPVGETRRAFHLGAEGKIRFDLLVHRDSAGFALVSARADAASLRAELDRRIVMEDVSLDAPDGAVVFAEQTLDGARVALPSSRFGPGFESVFVGSLEDVRADLIRRGHSELHVDALDARRVLAGMPRIGVDFDAALPQETGLARTTVSFTKGCYVGQEPVVMLEHRGKPPRRMVVLEGDAPFVPGPVHDGSGVPVGELRSMTMSAPFRGLGLIKRSASAPGTALVVGGVPVRVASVVEA